MIEWNNVIFYIPTKDTGNVAFIYPPNQNQFLFIRAAAIFKSPIKGNQLGSLTALLLVGRERDIYLQIVTQYLNWDVYQDVSAFY